MIEHLTPELVISGLRLLMESYKLVGDRFKDKKTPERVEDIVTHAEKSPTVNTREIEQSITQNLDPIDAAIVKNDLELLGLLVLPTPSLDAFDYWGKLTQLVTGLRTYATKNILFELRGVNRSGLGEVLLLQKTSSYILPTRVAKQLALPYQMQDLKEVDCLAFLRKEPQQFPIIAIVRAQFHQYYSMGGPPGVESDACYFDIGPGQQQHWLHFDRGNRSSAHFGQGVEYRLDASDFDSIVKALSEDIRDYATEVRADEQKIVPLFGAIDAFAKGLTAKS